MIPLTEPSGMQPLTSAADWVENVLLGSTAIVIATLAVATVGLLTLRGQVPFRRGASVLIGCFVLFGAATLARGIIDTARMGRADMVAMPIEAPAPMPPVIVPAQPQVYDPYAGAAVPIR